MTSSQTVYKCAQTVGVSQMFVYPARDKIKLFGCPTFCDIGGLIQNGEKMCTVGKNFILLHNIIHTIVLGGTLRTVACHSSRCISNTSWKLNLGDKQQIQLRILVTQHSSRTLSVPSCMSKLDQAGPFPIPPLQTLCVIRKGNFVSLQDQNSHYTTKTFQ
jgi:hypothetical protein